ncbi:hypothetical protein VN12_19605 [Pirellula sp. SH-Sr6A]|uniref:hypothetical protein n=1 Tax=Pirellula sp. SH-Sr6A TaxID=1632865 RepID=UPI00078DC647|nr:hypothetical protein [Pirellula sp. SH-Sr6A]AMV34341.1 hypothetical protein VN12_19605 [Pirellula sp. SH-Sr6A]
MVTTRQKTNVVARISETGVQCVKKIPVIEKTYCVPHEIANKVRMSLLDMNETVNSRKQGKHSRESCFLTFLWIDFKHDGTAEVVVSFEKKGKHRSFIDFHTGKQIRLAMYRTTDHSKVLRMLTKYDLTK